MNKKLIAVPSLMVVAALGFSTIASATSLGSTIGVKADTESTHVSSDVMMRGDDNNMMHEMEDDMHNVVFGTVTAINGSTITISSKSMNKNATTQVSTTYVVNASGAKIDKNTTAGSISNIAVGDSVMVQGTITGTNIVATKIHDGVMAKGAGKQTPGTAGMNIPNGNGQPIVGGTVTAVSGNTITITNKSNVTYTIDATNAKITKSGTTAVASNIAVGDTLVAQGTINGTSVAAVNIIDSGAVSANANGNNGLHVGFFGKIGNFFSRIFGFSK
ncbi:MAG: DUF5666 domain-containing protein [Candidatus Paceibacterota bacterium]